METHWKALILAPFDAQALERLRSRVDVVYESWLETRRLVSPDELAERIQKNNMQIVVIEADFVFDEVFEQADSLRFVGVCRGSVNNVDVDAATEHGVLVVSTPGRNASSVAELTLGLMLSLARHIPAAHSMVNSGKWLDPVEPYLSLRGIDLAGKTAGIVGFGAIGQEVARRLSALDMQVLAHDPYAGERIAGAGVRQAELDELMAESDFITIHCPPTAETSGLVGKGQINLMKHTAYLINTAGWDIVDEEALLDALQQGRIAGAAFDTYRTHPVSTESPFLKLDNVILTPHLGGATDGTVERHSRMMVEDIERFIEGRPPVNLLNPEAWRENGR